MKISIRNLWSLMCVLVLLAAEVSSASTPPTLTAGMIGKVTYLLGQADITYADGSVSPLALQMEIPDGSRITVKARSRVSLLMLDGGIEKLGADTIFTFNKYTYDPADPAATEIRKTLLEGEVTSTTGQGGEDAKERYRMNSPLAAIAVLGTEYTVKVSKGETWVTVHTGEISIAKLGGSCQPSGLGACAGGERLSEGQRGLAFVVRANEPKPILMPSSAMPVSENKAEAPPAPAKEAEKSSEKAAEKESATSEQAASPEKPAEPEAQNSTQASTPATTTDTTPIAEKATSSPEPKATDKASLIASPAPVTEKPPVAVAAVDERNPVDTIFAAKAVSAVEATSISTSERTQPVALESVASAALTTPKVSTAPPQTSTGSSTTSTTKAKQSLVQSSSSVASSPAVTPVVVPVTEKPNVVVITASVVEPVPVVLEKPKEPTVTAVVTPVLPVVMPAIEAVPVKPTTAVVTPVTAPVPEKSKTETVVAAPSIVAVPTVEPVPAAPEKPKEATVTAVVTPVTPVAPVTVTPAVEVVPVKPTVAVVTPVTTPVPEKPKTETVIAAPSVVAVPVVEPVPVVPVVPEKPNEPTVTAVVTPVTPAVTVTPTVEVVPVTPAAAVVTTTPAVELELPAPIINWGKYDPTTSVDGKTSLGEQVGSSYTQLIQSATISPSNLGLQQNPSVSLPETDKKSDVVAVDKVEAPVATPAAVAPVTITVVSTADTGKTILRDDSATPQSPVVTITPAIAVPLITAPLTAAPLAPAISTSSLGTESVLDRTSDSPLAPVTPLTVTPPLASP